MHACYGSSHFVSRAAVNPPFLAQQLVLFLALLTFRLDVLAHILKWQPLANLIGLHTAYELDRVGGRYRDIEQERTAERTIHSLSQDKPINLFGLRQRHTILALLLDAKYGSATFVPVVQLAELELRVSTTGLLMREANAAFKAP